MAIANSEPITTTNRIALSDSPNHKMASGSQQMEGSACSPITTGFTDTCRKGNRAIRIPSGTPTPIENR
jgi:hypothetical protein